ncbi:MULTISPECIES: alpha/beta hydrolase fold domain-containing protein [Bradyrhizobium]|nr:MULTISPECIES: alpha/beta hydrolase fold domain-containing protein [Bradyrhizobium]MCG2628248.1 FAD-dependent monooxygenase [Bradyrhizobium zhengyangense]MCG2643367.1 FAD-dependent monooxygenase [Bradyrhizobium zhengyangense]MCG2670319.1 FAD-dependent monooxygenase [Bradyrhizobium zhengyangense]MDN4985947.1 FAD-dependent monooxygenase [Bradyrhizobium sp. WYCCWR 13022]MDN5002673.1 FAD-dependent monooxygenase [Bradyrhizobium sp. WYCCWR 12677]
MRALIVGAGVAGLATAVALRRNGIDVTVIERAAELSEVGAGVVLGPHAMRVLESLGIAAEIKRSDEPPETITFYDMVSGEVRNRTQLGEAGAKLYGAPLYKTHRRDLIDALARHLDGTEIRLNCSVVDVKQDDRSVTVILERGEAVLGDLLIGADGLRSKVRSAIFGESESISTGLLAWRTVLPTTLLSKALTLDTNVWSGAGRHVVCYPIRRGKQFYAAFYVPADEIHREDWATAGDVADLRASFKDACKDVREITEAVTEAFITAINYRYPLPEWHRGRIVLIGDAAHPVLPTSGSGAAMALEDSVALAACLHRSGSNLEAAFSEFQARRKPRTTRLLHQSRGDLTAFHEKAPERQAAYGRMGRGMLKLDQAGYERFAWLYGYDEVAESNKPFDLFNASPLVRPSRPAAARAFDLWSNALKFEDEDWMSERAAYERFMSSLCALPEDVSVETVDCDGVPALCVIPPGGKSGPAVLHLHGGGYVFGSAKSSVLLAAGLARAIGGWALVPEFRLVPEHTPMQMQEDVRAAFAWLSRRADPVAVSGECSGGGLALSLAAKLRHENVTRPAALYLLSPFADLTLTAASIDGNRRTEPWMTRRRLLTLAGAFIQDREPDDPAISPLRGNLAGLPPMRVFAARGEALADDARALVAAAKSAGGDAELHLFDDSIHSFALFEFLPETDEFFRAIRRHAHSNTYVGATP